MTMVLEKSIICKLGGHVNSNPEIISSFPPLEKTDIDSKQLIFNFLPTGCKSGDLIMKRYDDYNLISSIFSIEKNKERDDLFSFAILLHKREKVEIYKEILTELLKILENNNRLNENILTKYNQKIYEGINTESDIYIEELLVDFSRMFKEIKAKTLKEKPKLRGSFI